MGVPILAPTTCAELTDYVMPERTHIEQHHDDTHGTDEGPDGPGIDMYMGFDDDDDDDHPIEYHASPVKETGAQRNSVEHRPQPLPNASSRELAGLTVEQAHNIEANRSAALAKRRARREQEHHLRLIGWQHATLSVQTNGDTLTALRRVRISGFGT